MTKEHFNTQELYIPIFIIINKIDMCPQNIINNTLKDLDNLVQSNMGGKKTYIIENDDLLQNINNHKQLFIEESEYNKTNIILNNQNIDSIENYPKL